MISPSSGLFRCTLNHCHAAIASGFDFYGHTGGRCTGSFWGKEKCCARVGRHGSRTKRGVNADDAGSQLRTSLCSEPPLGLRAWFVQRFRLCIRKPWRVGSPSWQESLDEATGSASLGRLRWHCRRGALTASPKWCPKWGRYLSVHSRAVSKRLQPSPSSISTHENVPRLVCHPRALQRCQLYLPQVSASIGPATSCAGSLHPDSKQISQSVGCTAANKDHPSRACRRG